MSLLLLAGLASVLVALQALVRDFPNWPDW